MKGKQYNTNQKSVGPMISGGGTQKVKTDGRIGSATPKSSLAGGFGNTDRNPGGQAYWAKRQAASKAAASRENRIHAHPINAKSGTLKKVKPT